MDHPRDHSLFWSWTFRDICTYIIIVKHLQSIYYIYIYIFSIYLIIRIYGTGPGPWGPPPPPNKGGPRACTIYIYICIHKPVCCPHRLGSQTVIGGFQLLGLQGFQVFFLAVKEGLCLFPRDINIVIYLLCFYMFLYCHRAQKIIYSYQVYVYKYMCVFICCFHTVNSIQNWDR